MKPDGWGSWPAPSTFWKWKNKKQSKNIKKAASAAFLTLPQAECLRRQTALPAQCLGCHTALPRPATEPGRPNAERQRKAPLVQRGDSMAQSCRGDCEADCIREGVIYSTLPGLHYGTFRCWLASAGAPRNRNAYSLGEFWERRHAAAANFSLCWA